MNSIQIYYKMRTISMNSRNDNAFDQDRLVLIPPSRFRVNLADKKDL